MTREEMIEQLENTILLIRQNGKDWWDDRDIPILEEVIKVMQTEPCKDTIDRQAAIKEILRVYEYEYPTATGAFDEFVTNIIPNIINNLPSVQPEQKTGEWIEKTTGTYRQTWCSRCGKHSGIGGNYKNRHKPFCPNCGAKMGGNE